MPNDFGPIYLETNFNHFPVEPWNTFSNLVFLAVFLYWAWRTRLSYQRFPLLAVGLPILFIGYVGGTIYHATRSHQIWLVMDFMPIGILCLLLSYWYWLKLLGNHWKVLAYAIAPFFFIRAAMVTVSLEKNMAISLGYLMLAVFLLLPLLIYTARNRPAGRINLVYSVIAFLCALSFRVVDFYDPELVRTYLPMGTHWLWHCFGGIATYFVVRFIYADSLQFGQHSVSPLVDELTLPVKR